MRLSAKTYAELLLALVKEGKIQEEVIASFLKLLRKNRQERLLPQIFLVFERLYKEQAGIKDVALTVPEALKESEVEHLEKLLEKSLHAQKVHIKVHVDPHILGGARLSVDDRAYDFSVRRQLASLRESLLR